MKINWVWLTALLIFGNCIRAVLIHFQVAHPAIYMLPFTHFEAMLGGIGIGLGLFDDLSNRLRSSSLLLAGLAVNAMVFVLPNTHEIGWTLMITYPLVGLGMTLTVMGVIKNDASLFIKLLRNQTLVYLGRLSFGLYIFHLYGLSIAILIVVRLFRLISPPTAVHQMLFFIGGLGLTILFAITSYQIVEKPFLKLKAKYGSVASQPI